MVDMKDLLNSPNANQPTQWPPAGVKWYFSDDSVAIAHADCREILPQLPKVDLVLTDPPYGLGLSMILNHGTLENTIHESSAWNEQIPDKECFDLIYEKSKAQIIWGCNYFGSNIRDVGRIVHDKQLDIKGTKLRYSEADIASCSLQKRVTIFRYRWNGNVQGNTINWQNIGPDARVHPTQKPIALMSYCILGYSKPEHLILDCFMGSGTTLLSAKNLGRKAIGIEIEEKYCEIAAKRMSQSVMELGI